MKEELIWECPKDEEIVSVTQTYNNDLLIQTEKKIYILRDQ